MTVSDTYLCILYITMLKQYIPCKIVPPNDDFDFNIVNILLIRKSIQIGDFNRVNYQLLNFLQRAYIRYRNTGIHVLGFIASFWITLQLQRSWKNLCTKVLQNQTLIRTLNILSHCCFTNAVPGRDLFDAFLLRCHADLCVCSSSDLLLSDAES